MAREAELADELDLRVPEVAGSAWQALGIRLLAHLPTLVAFGYAAVRLVVVTYQELLSPGNPAVPIALRVLGRAPDAIVIAVVAWLARRGDRGARRAPRRRGRDASGSRCAARIRDLLRGGAPRPSS